VIGRELEQMEREQRLGEAALAAEKAERRARRVAYWKSKEGKLSLYRIAVVVMLVSILIVGIYIAAHLPEAAPNRRY